MYKDWWIRAEEIYTELHKEFLTGKYEHSISKDLFIECTDKLQLELKEANILASEHLSSARIDMAKQLIDCAINNLGNRS